MSSFLSPPRSLQARLGPCTRALLYLLDAPSDADADADARTPTTPTRPTLPALPAVSDQREAGLTPWERSAAQARRGEAGRDFIASLPTEAFPSHGRPSLSESIGQFRPPIRPRASCPTSVRCGACPASAARCTHRRRSQAMRRQDAASDADAGLHAERGRGQGRAGRESAGSGLVGALRRIASRVRGRLFVRWRVRTAHPLTIHPPHSWKLATTVIASSVKAQSTIQGQWIVGANGTQRTSLGRAHAHHHHHDLPHVAGEGAARAKGEGEAGGPARNARIRWEWGNSELGYLDFVLSFICAAACAAVEGLHPCFFSLSVFRTPPVSSSHHPLTLKPRTGVRGNASSAQYRRYRPLPSEAHHI